LRIHVEEEEEGRKERRGEEGGKRGGGGKREGSINAEFTIRFWSTDWNIFSSE
jgi:hypothetical protein